MHVEITPEPDEDESRAILAALAQEPELRPSGAGGWARAELEEPLDP